MKILKDKDYRLFQQLVIMNQKSLIKAMTSFLQKHYSSVVSTKDYVYAVGDIPIALVAHLDTVFETPARNIYYDKEKNVIWSPEGLGADDRAGVFAIIQLIRRGFKPHIIFTTDEELGCVGAQVLVATTPNPIGDIKYIIQLDRRGSNDCVFYECDNPEFINYVESFGFVENFGSFSDISILCPMWKIAGVNLSIGYEDEHSVIETLHVSHMLDTIEKVISMLQNAENSPYFKHIPALKTHVGFGLNQNSFDWIQEELVCAECKQTFSEYEMFPVKSAGKTKFFCPDCVVKKANWCEYCGEAFEITPKNTGTCLCEDCVKKVLVK